jgi:hypothetical protein
VAIEQPLNSKVLSLRDEIQGATASATSELKKMKGQNKITWKSKGQKIQFSGHSSHRVFYICFVFRYTIEIEQ